MTPRYTITHDGEQGYIIPIDQEATDKLLAELREIMPEYSTETILEHVIGYALLAQRNLSHPSDDPTFQAAYDFMVTLANRLCKQEHGKDTWLRWNLGAKGQIEVTP